MSPDATMDTEALPAPIEVASGIHVVRIPLQVRVEPANAYLLRDDDGAVTIFDTGVAVGAAEVWQHAIAAIGATPSDVQRIVVSHHHPDHIGGAGPLHRLTGATMLASASTIEQGPDVWGDGGRIESYFESVRRHLGEHGFPDEVAAQLEHEARLARIAIDLPPDDAWAPLDHGAELQVAGRTWRVLATPGHADGHLVMLDLDGGLLLAGDHLLERISPAVGRFPRHEADPLGRYLESLELVAGQAVTTVLPGHGEPFSGAAQRAEALVEHHRLRIDQCVAAVAQLGPATAFEVARIAFPRVFSGDRPDAANQRFATTESLAHLERARFDGRLERSADDDGLVRYRTTAVEASGPVR